MTDSTENAITPKSTKSKKLRFLGTDSNARSGEAHRAQAASLNLFPF